MKSSSGSRSRRGKKEREEKGKWKKGGGGGMKEIYILWEIVCNVVAVVVGGVIPDYTN